MTIFLSQWRWGGRGERLESAVDSFTASGEQERKNISISA